MGHKSDRGYLQESPKEPERVSRAKVLALIETLCKQHPNTEVSGDGIHFTLRTMPGERHDQRTENGSAGYGRSYYDIHIQQSRKDGDLAMTISCMSAGGDPLSTDQALRVDGRSLKDNDVPAVEKLLEKLLALAVHKPVSKKTDTTRQKLLKVLDKLE